MRKGSSNKERRRKEGLQGPPTQLRNQQQSKKKRYTETQKIKAQRKKISGAI